MPLPSGRVTGPCKFSGEARLDFERLDAIAARLPGVPLVLHGASSVPQEAVAAVNAHGGNVAGASGVPEDLLRRAAASAICKINIDTDLRLAVTAAIRTLLAERPETFDPRTYLTEAANRARGWSGIRSAPCGFVRAGISVRRPTPRTLGRASPRLRALGDALSFCLRFMLPDRLFP